MTHNQSLIQWDKNEKRINVYENYTGLCGQHGWEDFTRYRVLSEKYNKYVAIYNEIEEFLKEKYDLFYIYRLELVYDYVYSPHKMIVRFYNGSFCIWSEDSADQEKTKRQFSQWAGIEEYYNRFAEKVRRRISAEEITQIQEQDAIKAERRAKRALNDPDNPAARKRKARRHLQRLGYDLHKSRRLALTAEDRGQYQIVKLDSGEITVGARFDLTLDEVERFYKDSDFERVEDKTCYKLSESGFLHNQEPKIKERKAAAEKALGKMGYALEVGKNKQEYYRNSCYRIRLLRNKRNIEIINKGGERYVKNGQKDTFTLSEVEDFITAKGHWKRR